MHKKPRVYQLDPKILDDMSPLQRDTVQEMLTQHKRLQWLITNYLLPKELGAFIAIRLKMMGLEQDEIWMLFVDKLCHMKANDFDQLYIEVNHYFGKSFESKVDGDIAVTTE